MLSGTGSDGTLGQLAIKGAGVMATVQSPDSAEYDGMPRSAIDTGLVDLILPPNRDGRPANRLCVAMRKIFVLLRAHCGHDFPPCKPNSIYRRIERLLAVHQIKSVEQYDRFLQNTRTEVEALFRDLLIGVTNFFRDPEAFRVLKSGDSGWEARRCPD